MALLQSRSMLPTLLLLTLLWPISSAQPIAYIINRSRSVKGNDYNCNRPGSDGKPAPHCYVCGGLAAVADACTFDSRCKGFDMQTYNCGFLKTLSNVNVQQEQAGFTAFCKGGEPNCRGEYAMLVGYDAAPGLDFECGAKIEDKVLPYCRRDGDHIALMNECNTLSNCDAFVIDQEFQGQFGYLKKINRKDLNSSIRKRNGFIYFLKRQPGLGLEGR